ncbi:unnamed protein product [Rhizopus stolonifer]
MSTAPSQEISIQDIEYEHEYFNDYDQEISEAVNQADYQDYQEDEYIMDERLLKLIVDVQSYLMDTPIANSHLLPLQYKMYTFLKQRALEN